MPFVTKTDLSAPVRERLEDINSQSAGERTAVDAAFLASRLQYVTNQILLRDENELISIASGNTVPTGVDGFKVGALFIDVDSVAVYVNTGTTSVAAWSSITSVDQANIADDAVGAGQLNTTTVPVVIDAAASSNTATVTEGAVIIGFYPGTNLDQIIDDISIDGTTLTVTLAAAATAETTINVVVLEP